MKKENRAIILIQLLPSKEDAKFNSELMAFLQQQKGQSDVLFSLDNFSDAITTQYALRLLDETDEAIIICEVNGKVESLGAVMAILNKAIRKDVKLYANKDLNILKPFMKHLQGKVFESTDELNIS